MSKGGESKPAAGGGGPTINLGGGGGGGQPSTGMPNMLPPPGQQPQPDGPLQDFLKKKLDQPGGIAGAMRSGPVAGTDPVMQASQAQMGQAQGALQGLMQQGGGVDKSAVLQMLAKMMAGGG